MPDNSQEIVLKLVLDGNQFNGEVQVANGDIKTLRGQTDGLNKSISSWSEAVTGFNQGLELAHKAMDFLSKPIQFGQMAGDEERMVKQLFLSLSTDGTHSREVVQMLTSDFVRWAEEMEKLTNFTHEETIQAAAMAKQLTGIDSSKMKEFLKGAMDLAAFLGVDLQTAIMKMSGSLEAGLPPFRGANEEFKKALRETKDEAGRLDLILGYIGEHFGGTAQTLQSGFQQVSMQEKHLEEDLGKMFLPFIKDAMGIIIPTIEGIRDNISTVSLIVGAATLSVILYTTALKAGAIAEALADLSVKKLLVSLGLKNIMLRFTTAAQELTAASTMAWGVATDLITGKITVQVATMNLLRLTAMSLGSVLTLVAGALAAVAILWSVYEMTAGRARSEMANMAYETEKVRLGLDKLQARLNSMTFAQLDQELEKGIFRLNSLKAKLDGLKTETGTGVAWLDWIGTFGGSEKVYNSIAITKSQITATQEYVDGMKKYQETVKDASDYASKFNDKQLKGLTSINAVQAAINQFTIANSSAEDDATRKSTKNRLDQLNKLKTSMSADKEEGGKDKPKTYEQLVNDKVKYYQDLTELDKSYTGDYKNFLDDQIDYYSVRLAAEKGGLKNLSLEELATLKDLKDKKLALEAGDKKEIGKLRVDAMEAGFAKDDAQIEEWYGEQKELKLYKNNAEAKTLIDKEYLQKKLDLNEKMNQKIIQLQIDAMVPGYAKERAQLEEWYRQQKNSDVYKIGGTGKSSIDAQYTEKGADLTRKEQKEINDAKIQAMEEGHDKELSLIEQWYKEGKENELYKTSVDYKASIDQQYYNKKLELAKKDVEQRNAINGAMLAGYDTFTQNLLSTDMSGAEKRQAIFQSVGNFFFKLLAEELRNYIITKLAETSVHGASEATKTGITAAGVGARVALIGLEIVATLAKAAASIVSAAASVVEWEVAMFGPFAIGTIPATLAIMYGMFAGIKSALGFKYGGRREKGQVGYFEGEEPEIVAPEKTFVQLMRTELMPQILSSPSALPVMSLLESGRDRMAQSIMSARNVYDRQGYSASGQASFMDKYSNEISKKLDNVIDAFVSKQWAIAGMDLKTVNDKTGRTVKDLRF